jgi:hypothetical protein
MFSFPHFDILGQLLQGISLQQQLLQVGGHGGQVCVHRTQPVVGQVQLADVQCAEAFVPVDPRQMVVGQVQGLEKNIKNDNNKNLINNLIK